MEKKNHSKSSSSRKQFTKLEPFTMKTFEVNTIVMTPYLPCYSILEDLFILYLFDILLEIVRPIIYIMIDDTWMNYYYSINVIMNCIEKNFGLIHKPQTANKMKMIENCWFWCIQNTNQLNTSKQTEHCWRLAALKLWRDCGTQNTEHIQVSTK